MIISDSDAQLDGQMIWVTIREETDWELDRLFQGHDLEAEPWRVLRSQYVENWAESVQDQGIIVKWC